MRCFLGAMTLLATGCARSTVEYDPVRDASRLSATVTTRTLESPKDASEELRVHLTGRGKHPASWNGALEVCVKASGGGPDVLGDTPTLVINPGSTAQRKVQASRQYGPKERLSEVNDSATFEVSINDLVYMIDRGRTIELNGTPWTLDDADLKLMRDLIATARNDTRAGR